VYRDYVLDNKNHHVSCDKLPTRAVAEAVVRLHHDVIDRIQHVGPTGSVFVELAEPCSGKADLVIYHPSREARQEIENIIGADTFYGIPYRLINV
jgi:predicted nucleotidyltransferase